MYSLTQLLIHLFIHSLNYKLIHSPSQTSQAWCNDLLPYSVTYSVIHSLNNLFTVTYSFIHLLYHSLTNLFPPSLIYLPTHSLYHSLIHLTNTFLIYLLTSLFIYLFT